MADDLDGDHKTEVITIAQQSGRAAVANFISKSAAPLAGNFQQGQFQVLPLNKTTKARRGMVWADVNHDQAPDLLVAEPDSGQLTIYLQRPDGSLAEGRAFSTLAGITDLAVAQFGKSARIYLLSPEERQVGVTELDAQGRLPFPTAVSLDGKPLAMAVGPARPGQKTGVGGDPGPGGKARAAHTARTRAEQKTQTLSEKFKANPARMAWFDADQDGLADLVVLIPYEKIKILRQVPEAAFEELDVAPPGGTVEQPWLSAADVDGDGKPELLLAQKNFVRAVVLKPEANRADAKNWAFKVVDQINGAASNSRIVGAAPLRNDTNRVVAPLFLLDAERKALTFCERNTNGVWEVVRNLSLPFSEFNELQPVALGGRQPNSIAFLGLNAVAWMAFGGPTWELAELDGYETPILNGFLHDVIAGDLNQDGRQDLVFLETSKNYLDLVVFGAGGKLAPANRWPVFEERTFRGRRGEQLEPREALIADVTGDGKNDLVVVVHDRILVYPQE